MLDQQVRHGVADCRVARWAQALERDRVLAVFQCSRSHREQDRLAGQSHVQRREIVVGIEGPGHFALRDRMEFALRHVLLARPQQLDRRSGHLLGDRHRLADIIRHAAPAEAAAKDEFVYLAFFDRQSRSFQHRGKRRFAVLRAAPDLAFVRRIERRGVHRLHGRMVLVGIVVDRLDLLDGAGNRGLGVAVLVADIGRLRIVEALSQPLCDRLAGDFGVLAFVPDDRQRIERGLGVPPGIGDDGDGAVVDAHDLLDALHAHDLGFVVALQLAAEHRTILDRGVEHARQLDVGAVDHRAGGLVDGVEPLDALADDLPVLRILQLHLGRRLELGGGFNHLAVCRRLARRRVGDDAVGGGAFRGRHLPFVRGGLHQHHARGGAALADVVLAGADAAAAAGREIAPGALACDTLSGGRIFGDDLRPVAFELFGDQLGEAGEGALTHFHGGVIGADHHPDIDFGRAIGGADDCRSAEGNIEADGETGAGGSRADHEAAASELGHDVLVHGIPLKRSLRRGSPRGPAERSRNGRCW